MTVLSVLSETKVRRLVRRANKRGRSAARARRTLTTAVECGDGTATEACWQEWSRDKTSWAFVPATVSSAAVDPAVDAAARAALGAFCVRNDLVPDNPVARTVFFLLTGQREQHQALDPDGTLLAGAYRGATEATREALRHTMIGSGELNMVRVIADRPDRVLTGAEADYLTGQLAEAGEWDRLWRLVPTMPLASAVLAARRCSDWRPADDLDRAFLARLASTDPDVLSAPAAAAVTPLNCAYPEAFSFALDATELAVRYNGGTKIFALPRGRQIESYADRIQLDMLALGDRTIVYAGKRGGDYQIVRRAPGREVMMSDAAGAQLGRTPGGFVVADSSGLFFVPTSGPWPPPASGPSIGSETSALHLVAADPVTGHLAFRVFDEDSCDLVVVDADLRELARNRSDGPIEGAFCGPDQLLLWHWGDGRTLQLFRRDGADLVESATVDLAVYLTPEPVPALGLVVVRDDAGLRWLDASTLTPAERPAGFPAMDCQEVSFSPDGTLAAVERERGAEVHDLWLHQVAELAGRPLSQARIADLETVAVPAKRQLDPPIGEVVELLRAGLAYQFGAEVALGSGALGAPRGDDIALGGR